MNRPFVICALAGSFLCRFSAAEEPKKPWKNSTEVSAVSANGNSHTTTTSAKEDFTYEWAKALLNLTGSALGASERNGVTAEEYTAAEKAAYKLTLRDYTYERLKWSKNRFAGIRNQYDSSAGYGRKLLMLTRDMLNGEIGGGYLNEERTNAPRNDFPSGRADLKYVHVFTPTSSFNQEVEYLHNFKSINGYHLNTETSVTTTLAAHLSLKTSFTWNRINEPAPGAVKDDTKVSAALLITY